MKILNSRYRLDRTIGQGGMGRVYAAYDTQKKREVAIKEVIFAAGNRATTLERVKREYYFLLAISHPNVVRAYDFFELNDHFFLVLEFVKGISLTRFVRSRPNRIPFHEQVAIAIQIARAVEVLNKAGIIHRDVKPENIILNEQTKVAKLVDLGIGKTIAKELQTITSTGALIGTPNYMSPEQIEGEIAPNSDVFSLGVTFYQFFLWRSSSPFAAENSFSAMNKIVNVDLAPLIDGIKSMHNGYQGAYQELSALIAKAVEKNPRRRIASAKELADRLVKIYSAIPTDGGGEMVSTRMWYPTHDLREQARAFGRHRIIKKLGQGHFAQVFLAYDPERNRKLVLKILSEQMADNVVIKRLYRESQAISQLEHANIVRIYEVSQEGDYHYVAIDYIEGRSLADILKEEKRIDAHQAVHIMAKIAKAVHHAHENKLLHRAIKPSNILLTKESEPYLCDFGLARSVRSGRKFCTDNIATAYMSPEQTQGKKREIDERSDIYSIGATLYHLVTGQTPDNSTPLHKQQLNIPPDIENICRKCMEQDKQYRYTSADGLARDLERFIEGERVDTRHSAILTKGLRWIRHRKIIAIFSCVALVVLALFFYTKAREQEAIEHYRALAREKKKRELIERELAEQKRKLAEQIARQKQKQELLVQKQKLAEQEQQQKRREWRSIGTRQKISSMAELMEMMMQMKTTNPGDILSLPNLPNMRTLPLQQDAQSMFSKVFTASLQLRWIPNSQVYTVWGRSNLLFYQIYARKDGEGEHYFERAVENFRKGSPNSGNHIAALSAYQSSYLFSDPGKAQAIAEEFLQHLPTEGEDAYFYFRKGCELRRQQQYKQSLGYFTQALAKNPAYTAAHLEQAIAYRNLGEYDKARKSLLQSCEIPSLSMPVLLELISLNLREAQINKANSNIYLLRAQQWYELMAIHNRPLIEARQRKLSWQPQQRLEEEDSLLVTKQKRWKLASNGWLLPSLVIVGYLPPEEGQLEELFMQFSQMTNFSKDKLRTTWGQAYLLLYQRHAQKSGTSKKYLAQAIEKFSTSNDSDAALLGYHSCYLLPQWDDKLAEKFLHHLPTKGEDSHYYFRKGCEARRKGQYQQSLEYFAKAQAKNPALTAIYLEQGIAYRDLGEYRKARESLLMGCELSPLSLPALWELVSLNLRKAQLSPEKSHLYRLRAQHWYEWAAAQYPALLSVHRKKWRESFPQLVETTLPEIILGER